MSIPGQQRTGGLEGQDPCGPVLAEVGGLPYDLELLTSPDLLEVHEAIAEQLLLTYPSVKRLADELCAPCVIRTHCKARESLEQRTSLTQEIIERRERYQKTASAPRWLTQALLQCIGMDSQSFKELTSDQELFDKAVADGAFNIDEFLGGFDFMPTGKTYYKSDLPELEHYTGIQEISGFEETLIVTEDGTVFSVLECTQKATNFDRKPLNVAMYRLLSYKILKSIIDPVSSKTGKAQIFTANERTNKLLSDGRTYERKKARTKDRLYYTLRQGEGTPENPHRVVFLGGSSGDEDDQQEFIDSLYSIRRS